MTAENKRCRLVGHKTAEVIRYNECSTAERVNARLKDEFGGRVVRVRGHAKVRFLSKKNSSNRVKTN